MSQYQPWAGSGHVRGRKLATLVLSSAAVLVVGTACGGAGEESSTEASSTATTTTTTAPPPPPGPPPVGAGELQGLLPSLEDLKTIMNNQSLIAGPNATGVAEPDPSQQVYEPADCASSFTAGSPSAFDGTGYRGFLGNTQAQSPTPSLMLGESVVTFDTAEAAKKALAKYVEQWRRCANTQFTWKFISQGRQAQFTLGDPVDAGGGVTSLRNVNPDSPVTVTRAIAAKNNVLVDVQIMGSNLAEQNVTIAKRILERIPG